VDTILQAAGEVVADRGWAGTTTNHIAERAGVSIGSVYQYFPNKDSILIALMERHLKQVQPIVQEAIEAMDDESVPVAKSLDTLFARLVEMHAREPRLNRVLAEQVPLPPVVEKMHAEGELSIAHRIAASLERRRDTRSDDALAMAHVLAQATEALSRWIAHHAPASLDKQAYTRQAVRMLADFVAAKPERRRPRA
jgi:AcrR family transcriptional regulator